MQTEPAIRATRLTKRFTISRKRPGLSGAIRHLVRPRFETKLAVDSIDFAIEAGESVAYAGPNGAGKSTTLKMLAGILVPTSGELSVLGLVPHRQRVQNARNIGVVFGQRSQLWWDLPVRESLRMLGDIYAIPKHTFARNWNEYVDLLEIGPLLHQPARQLSLGQRMRCDLVASLLHSPSVLFLDEPTIGLDAIVRERLRALMRHVNVEQRVTVLLTSHDMSDVQDICRRIIVIDRGKIVFDGPLGVIRERFGTERVLELLFSEAVPSASDVVSRALADLGAVEVRQAEPYSCTIQIDARSASVPAAANRLLPLLPVKDIRITEPSMETIVRRLYSSVSAAEAGAVMARDGGVPARRAGES